MTQQEIEVIGTAVGEAVAKNVAEIIAALTLVVVALRRQPGFNNSEFDAEIQKMLDAPNFGQTTKKALSLILDAQVSAS